MRRSDRPWHLSIEDCRAGETPVSLNGRSDRPWQLSNVDCRAGETPDSLDVRMAGRATQYCGLQGGRDEEIDNPVNIVIIRFIA